MESGLVNGKQIFNSKVTKMAEHYFLGIDIAKQSFQAALTVDGQTFYEQEVENNAPSIRAYFSQLKRKFKISFNDITVCLEHTGIYSYVVLDYLSKTDACTCVEPALQIKQSQGMKRGKSDRVDARRIAHYALKNRNDLKLWKPQRPVLQKIKALLGVRDRLIKTRLQIQAPIRETEDFVSADLRKMMIQNCRLTLQALQKDIRKVEDQINETIKEDQSLSDQVRWATSVPGIGKITALQVILSSGELNQISDVRKFACYAGVAPFEHSSGSSIRGKTRVSRMANMTLKKLLHMAAMSAIQCCEELRAYYERKVAAGKNKMSVLNAIRNKLIGRVFSCIRNKRVYQKDFQLTIA